MALLACLFAKISNTRRITVNPKNMPMSGEVNSGMTTLESTPPHSTVAVLRVKTIVAPMRLPISAWLELEGIENHQVRRSQMMAPSRAARIT